VCGRPRHEPTMEFRKHTRDWCFLPAVRTQKTGQGVQPGPVRKNAIESSQQIPAGSVLSRREQRRA
jgi:hypothetical protein